MKAVQSGIRANLGQFSLLVVINAFVGGMVGMERSILPQVAEGAVVAAPDDRLGERAVAFLRLRPGSPAFDLAQLQRALGAAGLPKTKWVEGLYIVDDFPRTPSGKIRKFVLRDELRRG